MFDRKLLIVDGNALFTKCYCGNLPMEYKKAPEEHKEAFEKLILHNKEGFYTNGIYSFMKIIENIIKDQKPSHMAFCFDVSKRTFRKEMYEGYKEGRKAHGEPFKMQMEVLPKMLMDMGFTVFMSQKDDPKLTFEGDDLIGSLCNQFKGQISIVVLTNDHDMTQLVEPGVGLWMMVQSNEKAEQMFLEYTQGNGAASLSSLNLPEHVFPMMSVDTVLWDMGVYPNQITDYKGLAGDTSDKIPGVKGISEKTAPILLKRYGNIENLFEAVEKTDEKDLKEEWKSLGISRPPIKALKAADAKESAELSKKLATIIRTLHFPIDIDQMKVNVNQNNRIAWYQKFGFKSLLGIR